MAAEVDSGAAGEKVVYRKMAEFKKKISLVEGQRKAVFAKCEKEKWLNKVTSTLLKDEFINLNQQQQQKS